MYLTMGLHRAVQQHAQRIAVSFAGRERTFGEFAERVARLAAALQTLGMSDGDRVAMLALNSDRYLEYQMAVPFGGGVVNPCNTRWSAAELLYALDDSGSTILIVDDTFAALGEKLRRDSQTVREVIYCGDQDVPAGMHGYEALVAAATPASDRVRRGADLAGIFYTGGTTGFPKGVMLNHESFGIGSLTLCAADVVRPAAVYLHAAPMFHIADAGIGAAHWLGGSRHVTLAAFDAATVVATIEQQDVTHTTLVPAMIQRLVDELERNPGRHDLSSLEVVAYGAAPMSPALLARAKAAFPTARFVQLYGMTEAAPVVIEMPADEPDLTGPDGSRGVGRPSSCMQVKIVDADGVEVPRNTVGEVVVRGPTVMMGYWNNPDQTAAALRDGWYFTGDGAYMDDHGFLHIVDRLKDMIVSGGENVYSAEVEYAIAAHPAVAAAAVIAIPNAQWGETVHAVVVPRPGMTLTAEDVIAHCKTRIAGYKCPRSVEFANDLPLSGAGKVLKTALRERYWKDQPHRVA